ncbi:MAG: replication endonuclease [Sulfurimicrobium sp.]|nr:replication endonuclease [Sulfurimicrobium sp.]
MFARQTPPDLRELLAPNVAAANKVLANLETNDPDDEAWRNKTFALFPPRMSQRIAREYEELFVFSGEQTANLYLLEHWERVRKVAIPIQANEVELEQLAKRFANEMRQTVMLIPDDVTALVRIWKLAESYGIAPPSPDDPNITIRGALNRLYDDAWWLRQLRKAQARRLEEEAIGLGMVHSHAAPYVSDETLQRHTAQKTRNRRILAKMVLINEENQAFLMKDIASKGMSNPVNRRNELMAWLSGFENIADSLGHVAAFLTITCPSRMHARLSKSGDANPKYDGTTPREAQAYLTKLWSKIRAKLKRDEIQIYGFRVAEPHQDGTPHWHLLVFMAPESVEPLRQVFLQYALQEDADEAGARQRRFTWQDIDKSKGSAVGYIAKYISKNIDAYGIDEDETGLEAKGAAERVNAWASTWGIRQFQQFGGPSVGIWRELRRANGGVPEGVLKQALEAADEGDWSLFLQALGGPTPKRKDIPIQLAKEEQNDTGKYGDPKGKKIIGVKTEAFTLKTRIHTWRILLVSSNGVCIVSDTIIEAAQQEAPAPRAPAGAHGADAFAAKPPLAKFRCPFFPILSATPSPLLCLTPTSCAMKRGSLNKVHLRYCEGK